MYAFNCFMIVALRETMESCFVGPGRLFYHMLVSYFGFLELYICIFFIILSLEMSKGVYEKK